VCCEIGRTRDLLDWDGAEETTTGSTWAMRRTGEEDIPEV